MGKVRIRVLRPFRNFQVGEIVSVEEKQLPYLEAKEFARRLKPDAFDSVTASYITLDEDLHTNPPQKIDRTSGVEIEVTLDKVLKMYLEDHVVTYLYEAGYDTIDRLRRASIRALESLPSIGPITARKVKVAVTHYDNL